MHVIALVTCPDRKAADRLSKLILERRLAACINVIGGVRSSYRWKGKIEKAEEALMLIKTTMARVKDVELLVKQNHPYEVPEFIVLPVKYGSGEYLAWMSKESD